MLKASDFKDHKLANEYEKHKENMSQINDIKTDIDNIL